MENSRKITVKTVFAAALKLIETIIMLVVLFICAVIVVQRVTNNEDAFLGFRVFKVETGSMIPKYNIADVILVREKEISKLEVGDDVVYIGEKLETKGKVITHQLVRKETSENGEEIFYTKGIANNKEDPAVYGHQILGVVERKIYTISFIMNLFLNGYTLYFFIILPLTIYLFFNALYGREKSIRQDIRARNKKAIEKIEKEKKKQQEREDKIKQRRLGTREVKRIDSKSTPKADKNEEIKTDKKENKKTEKKKSDKKETKK